MRCFKNLLLLILPGILICTELSAQCCGRKVVVRRRCSSSGCFVRSGSRRTYRRRFRRKRVVNRMNYTAGNSNFSAEDPPRPYYDMRRTSMDGARYMGSLRKIHALQLRLIREKSSLSLSERSVLLRDLRMENQNLSSAVSQIRTFPYRDILASPEETLERLCSKGNVSEEQMLLHIQKLQMRSMKNRYAR